MLTTLVTGANRGIGLELCRLLKQRGDAVVAVCRETSPDLEALKVRIEAGVDVTSDASVKKLVARLEGAKLDWLVNNAGILAADTLETLDFDSVRKQLEVNALGPLRVTAALVPSLKPGGKVGIVTSRMGSITDNESGGYYGYRMSKAALNMAGVSLARDLRGRRIAVALLHPGYVRTRMTRGGGSIEPMDAAKGLIARLDALTLEASGGFWHANGETLPW
jgi:NAD(P)-dependent dehydrogenase (short-subunit alcohol dehydrogenase family)